MDKISKTTDLYDEQAMIIYDYYLKNNQKISYLKALIILFNILSNNDEVDELPSNLKEDIISKISQIKVNQEELRKALFLLEIKAYKQLAFPLDSFTPDAIGVIISFLLPKKNLTILDLGMGSGNLSFVIADEMANKGYDVHLIGIEQDQLLCELAAALSNLLMISSEIHMEDCLSFNYPNVDILIADVSNYEYHNDYYQSPLYSQGVRKYVYLLMEKHLDSIVDDGLQFYIVDTDFFSCNEAYLFKQELDKKAYIKAIINLPSNFFKEKQKMIIVLKSNNHEKRDTHIINIPNIDKNNEWRKVLLNLKELMEK